MHHFSTAFQLLDRGTGTELSPQQQQCCHSSYTIIKAYIDDTESQAQTPLPWSRRKLRYSTAQLLDSIESLANDIREREQGRASREIYTHIGSGFIDRENPKNEGSQDSHITSTEYYEEAINLLHELVNRLANVSEAVASRPELPVNSLIAQGLFVPRSMSGSSDTSVPLSNLTTSRLSYVTSDTSETDSNIISENVFQSSSHNRNTSTTLDIESHVASNVRSVDESKTEVSNPYMEKRKKATNDWVLEYLRGGWLSKSPVTDATLSPIFPMHPNDDTFPMGSYRQLRRTDSEESSNDFESLQHSRSNSTAGKTTKNARSIPAAASRFKRIHPMHTKSSNASVPEAFQTPRSIMSGATVYCTPNVGMGYLDSATQAR